MRLPRGTDLVPTVTSDSEDLLWGLELVAWGTRGRLISHQEVLQLSLLPSHGLYVSSLTLCSCYDSILVVKIKS